MYLPLNSYKDKEATEWSNFWYDQANVRGGHIEYFLSATALPANIVGVCRKS